MFESNKRLPGWREAVVMACKVAFMEHGSTPMLGPVNVQVQFFMPRPKSTTRQFPNVAPDLDKLQRAVGDALEQSGVLSNDAQIIYWMAQKFYANDKFSPGAIINVKPSGT